MADDSDLGVVPDDIPAPSTTEPAAPQDPGAALGVVPDETAPPTQVVRAADQVKAEAHGYSTPPKTGHWGYKEDEEASRYGIVPDEDAIKEAKYTTPGQQAGAVAEGLGEGAVGFLAPLAEKLAGVDPEDIENREKYNKGKKATAEAAALVGTSLADFGFGAVIGAGGELAAHAVGLGKPAGYAAKVGSEVVNQAVQMGLFQSSNEITKNILNNPDSVGSAIANVGTAMAIGGGIGAFTAGVAHPLWKASGGEKKLADFLRATKYHMQPEVPTEVPDEKTLELVHYSPKELKVIDPAYAGTGVDAGVKGRSLEQPLSHFYIKGAPRSPSDSMVNGIEHSVKVDLNKTPIYDYGVDPEGIVKAAKESNGGAFSLDVANKMLKEKGYSGFQVSNNPDNYNTVMMFDKMPVHAINGVEVDQLPRNFSMISAQVGKNANPAKRDALKQALESNGFTLEDTMGHYGYTPEHSFMVHHSGSPEDIAKINALGKQFGQESVLHSTESMTHPRQNALVFMDGSPTVTGQGSTLNSSATTNYTVHPQLGKFQLQLGPKEANPLAQTLQKVGSLKATRNTVAEAKDEALHQLADNAYDIDDTENSPLTHAMQTLGVQPGPVLSAAMHGHPKALNTLGILLEKQNPEATAAISDLARRVETSVVGQMRVPLEDIAHYSDNEGGRDVYSAFEKEYNQHYAPVAKMLEERDRISAPIQIADRFKNGLRDDIIETGMQAVGTDSPYYKTYEHYGQRVLAQDTIGNMDRLKTELFNKARSMSVDNNEKMALNNIRNMITEFQEKQIDLQGVMIGNDGLMTSGEAMAKRQAANSAYKSFSAMSSDFADHTGIGSFRGAGTLKQKLEGMAPEDLLKKFSPKGDADMIPFLKRYFPETADAVQDAESKKFMSGSVYSDKGEARLDLKKLARAVERSRKGSPEYTNFVAPKELQDRLDAAHHVLDAIPKFKSSGTAGWLYQIGQSMPSSALSTVGYMMGHNPVSAWILNHLGERVGKAVTQAQEARQLAYLKYLSTAKPTNAAGFKAMTDTIDNVVQGEKKLQKATAGVFTPGAAVLSIGTMADRAKLDSAVASYTNDPNEIDKRGDNSDLAHYMPDHQMAMNAALSNQMKYLSSLKPKPYKSGPLDRPIEPSDADMARYHRALDLANNPMSIMNRVKDGTIQVTDLQDLQALYPSVYQKMQERLMSSLADTHLDGKHISYETRMGLSMFLQTPVDSSMSPESIIAAQPKPTQGQQPQGPMKGRKGKSAIDRMPDSYKTQSQAAESDRGKRD